MPYYPFNPNLGQKIQSNAKGASFDQGFLAHIILAAVLATNVSKILLNQATSAAAITNATVFAAQPDVARQLSITPTGTTANVTAGNITVTGTDAGGLVITEAIAVAAGSAAAVFSTRAFKTVTNISIPIQGAGVTFNVGVTDKLGIPYLLAGNTVLVASLNGVREAALPTVTPHATDYTKNLIQLSSALNGTAVEIHLIV